MREVFVPGRASTRGVALKLKRVDGLGGAQIGKLGLHVTSVNRIIKRYDEEGLQALVTKRHDHGNRCMTREEEATFLARFMAQDEAGTVVEVADIHKAYEKAVGHPVARSAIYYILHKHGWRKVMPRGKHPKRASRAAILDFQKTSEEIQKQK